MIRVVGGVMNDRPRGIRAMWESIVALFVIDAVITIAFVLVIGKLNLRYKRENKGIKESVERIGKERDEFRGFVIEACNSIGGRVNALGVVVGDYTATIEFLKRRTEALEPRVDSLVSGASEISTLCYANRDSVAALAARVADIEGRSQGENPGVGPWTHGRLGVPANPPHPGEIIRRAAYMRATALGLISILSRQDVEFPPDVADWVAVLAGAVKSYEDVSNQDAEARDGEDGGEIRRDEA